jgi:hypothetical protein
VLPEYASCELCGEYQLAALRKQSGMVICANCADHEHRIGPCAVCNRDGPVEQHHVAGKRHAPDTLQVCLNCHAVLSRRQYQYHPSWRSDVRPNLFLAQGWLDTFAVSVSRAPAGPADKIFVIAMFVVIVLALAVPDLFLRLLADLCAAIAESAGLTDAEWRDLVVTEDLP